MKKSKKYQAYASVHQDETVRLISAKEAVDLGWTPGRLRVIANSLERIAGRTEPDVFAYQANRRGDIAEASVHTTNFNPSLNRQNAHRFRSLASAVERLLRQEKEIPA